MTDLDKLIEAVEAGSISTDLIMDAFGHGWDDVLVLAAFDGDLDAALRLHDAQLPGWAWEGGSLSNSVTVYPPFYPGEDFDAPCYSGENAKLSRALLLAILRAVKAQGGRG